MSFLAIIRFIDYTSESNGSYAYNRNMSCYIEGAGWTNYVKDFLFSVRSLQD
ncbi:MAG: hypothetical protein LBH25_12875 [Fibromonadaceae bacterium]|nr:hypothetical protein [Fibromonadaceae bacterium]